MSRPKKKEIKFSKDSILSLLQEVYNEIVEQRNTAIRIQNKMLAMMKETEDMTVLGPIIKEQQKIINDCVEKKLSLSKLQSSIWEKSNVTQEQFSLSDLDVDDTILTNLIQKDVSKTDEPYKMKK
jgi:methionine salvage enolase-phosphatase E1